jgi:hypothetical protein
MTIRPLLYQLLAKLTSVSLENLLRRVVEAVWQSITLSKR